MNSNPETIRLYDNDAYLTEFQATILSIVPAMRDSFDGFAVVLDQTAFFPEEGGQTPDLGKLHVDITDFTLRVVDVQMENQQIIHYALPEASQLTTEDLAQLEGSSIHGCIDWTHRFYNMQQHSGEHIFSGLVHKHYGYDNVGFHLSDQIVTMDFNGVLTEEQVLALETEANQVIAQNVPIHISYPSKEELSTLSYRSKIEIEGQVRLVTIEGYDVCACCAPHVRNTGEIGMLKIMNLQNYKGGVRLSLLCGFRALDAFREKADLIRDLTALLTTGQDKLYDTISQLKKSAGDLNYQLGQAKQALLLKKLEDIPSEQTHVILFEENLDAKVVRNVVNQLVGTHEGFCAIFQGNDTSGYQYILGSSTRDCKELATLFREKWNAKGGGSPRMIQGSVTATQASILDILNSLT